MAEPDHRIRRRGVRASRTRLARALLDAGLKTQAALAERIADLEHLEGAPKDVVNRVFRELPVDPQTLERVARALGVTAEAITLPESEVAAEPDEPASPPGTAPPPAPQPGLVPGASTPLADTAGRAPSPPTRSLRRPLVLAAVALALLVVTLSARKWLVRSSSQAVEQTVPPAGRLPPLQPRSGRLTLAVLAFRGDDGARIAEGVRQDLARSYGVASAASTDLSANTGPEEVAQRLQLDAVVEGETVRVGRQLGVRAWIHARGQRVQVWAEMLPLRTLGKELPALAARIAAAIERAIAPPSSDGAVVPHFPLAVVQDEVLQGFLHLDRASSEINLKRAITRFEAALRGDSNDAEAHAGLCQALVQESALTDEQRHLIDAERACARALQLNPRLIEAQTAQADLLRRTGRTPEAIRLLGGTLALAPDDPDVLLALAEAEFSLASGDQPEHMTRALALAREATDADPTYWKPAYRFGSMEFTAGHLDRAIAAAEQAQAREANEYTVTNLGTFYFCQKQFAKARDQYLRARELAPGSYVGDEFLGMIYYFLRQYPESARLRKASIQAMSADGEPEMHALLGNLGDSYRQMGARREAVGAYAHALELVERDFLRGIATRSDRASRGWYQVMLATLDPGRVDGGGAPAIDTELQSAAGGDLTSGGYIRLAQLWQARGDRVRAREALTKSGATCPGFTEMPDFDALKR